MRGRACSVAGLAAVEVSDRQRRATGARALVLSDDAISAALWTRTLPPPPDAARCFHCTETPPFATGHLDTCASRKAAHTLAHERVKYAVARALGNVAGADVDVEPTIRGRQSRNDVRLRLIAAAACPLPSIDIDVSIMAASCKTAPAHRRDCSSAQAVAASIQLTLNVRATTKREKQPDPTTFLPFVLSAGGILLYDAEKALVEWRKHTRPSEIGYMFERIACALLNRRLARFSTITSHDTSSDTIHDSP